MSKMVVTGGYPLSGECRIRGAKNAALPILAACVLTRRQVLLRDCPQLTDVENMLGILRLLGCRAEWCGQERDLLIDAANAGFCELPERLAKELRSSVFLLGPMIGRFGRASVPYPGGCEIGNRPVDLHIRGLSALGVQVREESGRIECAGGALTGAEIHLDYPSVGATENIMMAAVAATGETVIRNAAREPEILDLQRFLCAAGFRVSGAGSSTVVVQGGGEPREVEHRILPDRIVAGTMLTAAAMTMGSVTCENVVVEHLSALLSKLCEAGCRLHIRESAVSLLSPGRPRELKLVETLPHPGFPTDMQAQIFALCTVADGTSVIVENVFENRFQHAQELSRMGAVSTVKGRTAVIRGVRRLTGSTVAAHDLRGGAALVLAGMCADGVTTVTGAEHIDRGYERLETALCALGAQIKRETEG